MLVNFMVIMFEIESVVIFMLKLTVYMVMAYLIVVEGEYMMAEGTGPYKVGFRTTTVKSKDGHSVDVSCFYPTNEDPDPLDDCPVWFTCGYTGLDAVGYLFKVPFMWLMYQFMTYRIRVKQDAKLHKDFESSMKLTPVIMSHGLMAMRH